MKKKNILIIVNYYSPYISGLTEHARIAAEMLARDGHHVVVLASNHDNLPKREIINGVHVYRADVIMKISKGVISTEFIMMAIKLAKSADIVNFHCPMLESGLISLFIPKNKIVTVYHCDVNLPKSFINNMIVKIMDISNSICLSRSRKISVTTKEYAMQSRIAYKYSDKMYGITAPVKEYKKVDVNKDSSKKYIGFCGRIVEEKGIDVLVKAFEIIRKKRDDVELLIAGDYKNVVGGSVYQGIADYIEEHKIENVTFLGKLPEEDMEKFFSKLDVFVLPSVNSLEAFGVVQVEAMNCGTPVIASDLPGVRTIVDNTKAGLITKRGDFNDLADCITEVIDNKEKYVKNLENVEKFYSAKIWEDNYKKALFE